MASHGFSWLLIRRRLKKSQALQSPCRGTAQRRAAPATAETFPAPTCRSKRHLNKFTKKGAYMCRARHSSALRSLLELSLSSQKFSRSSIRSACAETSQLQGEPESRASAQELATPRHRPPRRSGSSTRSRAPTPHRERERERNEQRCRSSPKRTTTKTYGKRERTGESCKAILKPEWRPDPDSAYLQYTASRSGDSGGGGVVVGLSSLVGPTDLARSDRSSSLRAQQFRSLASSKARLRVLKASSSPTKTKASVSELPGPRQQVPMRLTLRNLSTSELARTCCGQSKALHVRGRERGGCNCLITQLQDDNVGDAPNCLRPAPTAVLVFKRLEEHCLEALGLQLCITWRFMVLIYQL